MTGSCPREFRTVAGGVGSYARKGHLWMRPRTGFLGIRYLGMVFLSLALSGCVGSDGTTTTTVPVDDRTPSQVALELLKKVGLNDVAGAADLTVTDQAMMVALIEGVGVDSVYALEGSRDVIESFWAGFADLSGSGLLFGSVNNVDTFESLGTEFSRVFLIIPPSTEPSFLVLRKTSDGWRIDLIASFMTTFAGRLAGAAQASAEGPVVVFEEFKANVPSMEAALSNPDLTGTTQQAILRSQVILGFGIGD